MKTVSITTEVGHVMMVSCMRWECDVSCLERGGCKSAC